MVIIILNVILSYQRAFIDFFEDQLVRFAYDWKAMINYFLFDGEKPLVYSLIAGSESNFRA